MRFKFLLLSIIFYSFYTHNKVTFAPLHPSGHYMYRTLVTICTARWSLYVPHIGHYMYRTVVTICTASGHYMYRTVVTICTASGHYMHRTVVTICTAQWSLYVPPVVTICKNALSEMAGHQRLFITHRFYSFYMQHSTTGLPADSKMCLCSVGSKYMFVFNFDLR